MRLVKAVLFDLDGTLVDSLPELYHGVHTVLSDMGLKAPSQEAVGAMIGRGILVLVQRLCAALGIAVESEQGRDLSIVFSRHGVSRAAGTWLSIPG